MERSKRKSKNTAKSAPQSANASDPEKMGPRPKAPISDRPKNTNWTGSEKKSASAEAMKNQTSRNPSSGQQRYPSPSSTAHRIPQINLSAKAPSTAQEKVKLIEKKPSWAGEIIIPANFKAGDCHPVQAKDGKCLPDIPKGQVSDIGLGGPEERAVDFGEKLYVFGGYHDKFLYLFGSQVSSEAKRKNFTAFLRSSGILQLISKFILALQEMNFRPPPEEAVEFMLKSMGSKLIIRDLLKEMMAYRDEAKLQVEKLTRQSEELHLQLENYEPVVSPYEVLDPDDFGGGIFSDAKKSQSIRPEMVSALVKYAVNQPVLCGTNLEQTTNAEENHAQEEETASLINNETTNVVAPDDASIYRNTEDEEEETTQAGFESDAAAKNILNETEDKPISEDVKVPETSDELNNKNEENILPLNSATSIKIELKPLELPTSSEGKLKMISTGKVLDDLDVNGLLQYFTTTCILDLMNETSTNPPMSIGSCIKLPPIEMGDDKASEPPPVNMPPLVVMESRKYMKNTKIFKYPSGKLLKSAF